MWSIVVLLCMGVLAAAMPQAEKQYYDLESADEHFEGFIQQHNKQYATEKEKQVRFEIFKQNLKDINQLNANSDHAVYGITQFTDLTQEEFQLYNNLGSNYDSGSCNMLNGDKPISVNPPTEFDWRSKNVVTEVKNQQKCGSCWAFSTIGNVESQYAIKHGKLVSLSEQELVACDQVDQGCYGGLMDVAMRQLIKLGGVMSEQSYPYTAHMDKCDFKKQEVVALLKDCDRYTFTKEENLRKILFTVGPLSIAMYAFPLQHYKSGIMNVKDCPAENPDHGVLLVGFGEDNGVPYWLIKNSWSKSFGINGYFKLQRNENACNITAFGAANAIMA